MQVGSNAKRGSCADVSEEHLNQPQGRIPEQRCQETALPPTDSNFACGDIEQCSTPLAAPHWHHIVQGEGGPGHL